MKKNKPMTLKTTQKIQDIKFSVNLRWQSLETSIKGSTVEIVSLFEELTAILMADVAQWLKISMDDTKKLFNLVFENADKKARKTIWEVETQTEKGNFISNFFKKWKK